MNFKVNADKITGLPDQAGWVLTSDFQYVEGPFAQKGRLFVVMSFSNDAEKKELILQSFHQKYFSQKGDPFLLLQHCITEIQKDFNLHDNFQMITALVLDEKIILSGAGKVQAWVLRNKKLSKLIEPKDGSNAVMSASGILQDGDQFFIGTNDFFDKIKTQALVSESEFITLIKKPESRVGGIKLKVELIPEPLPEAIPKLVSENKTKVEYQKPRISPVRLILAKGIDKILSILPEKKNYIREEFVTPGSHKKKKIATLGGAIILLVLALFITYGMKHKKVSDSKAQYEPILSAVERDLTDAQNIAIVNNARARNLILTAKEQIGALIDKSIKDPRISDLQNRINDALGGIAGIYNQEPSLYLDLTLLNSTFKGDDISVSGGRAVVLDRAGKRLETIDIGTSKADPIAGPDIMPNANLVASYSDRNFVSSDNGIWEIGAKAEVLIPKDKDIGNNILISAYAGNFYVLDKDNGKLWRYQGDGGQFGTKENWFGAGVKPDLSSVISWTIDGNVWMLTSGGNILRFQGGSPIDFTLKNMDKDLKGNDIFTNENLKYLYVLDSDNSRVLVLNKDGNYKAQYLGDNIKNAKKIVVSEDDKKILLLEGDKLFSLDIKHL